MQISPFWFCLNFHLHQGLLWSSPNVDVNETAVELEISFKMLCLATPLCKCYKGYVTTKPEMSMTLMIMKIIMSDSGST